MYVCMYNMPYLLHSVRNIIRYIMRHGGPVMCIVIYASTLRSSMHDSDPDPDSDSDSGSDSDSDSDFWFWFWFWFLRLVLVLVLVLVKVLLVQFIPSFRHRVSM